MRRDTCACGQLSADCEGEPVRVPVCHCLACQRRSGSAFAAQAWFPREAVRVARVSREWRRVGEAGGMGTFSFCPECSSIVHYAIDALPDRIAVPLGGFAGSDFPPPGFSIYEERKHRWVAITGDGVEHLQ